MGLYSQSTEDALMVTEMLRPCTGKGIEEAEDSGDRN